MKRYAFVDESGNEGMRLDQQSVSSHYVVCALVLNDDEYAQARSDYEGVRKRYFHDSEMKSASVLNDVRRTAITRELANTPCSIYLLVGDKSKLTSPGFRYPKTFIKHLQGQLYRRILQDYPAVHVRADQIKNTAFMREFEHYLCETNRITLFSPWSFDWVDSKADVCVQAADFISGTVARCFERNKVSPARDELLQLLEPRVVLFQPFPETVVPYTVARISDSGRFDAQIESRAVSDAENFIGRFGGDEDMDRQLQVACLRALLTRGYLRDTEKWVQTGVLLDHLHAVAGEEISEQKLRHVIGGLRDEGVLVASRTAGGYKLPTCVDDLIEFLNRQNTQLAPMISRIRKARETVRRATGNDLDILSYPEYAGLKAVIEATPHWSMRMLREADDTRE